MKKLILLTLIFAIKAQSAGFSGRTWLEHRMTRHADTDANPGNNDPASGRIDLYLRYAFETGHSFQTRLRANFNYEEHKYDMNDPIFYHIFNLHNESDNSVSIDSDLRLGLSASEFSRENREAFSFLTWAPSLSFDLYDSKDLALSFLAKPYISRYFNKEDISGIEIDPNDNIARGTPNIETDIYNLFVLAVNLKEYFSFEVGYAYTMQWNTLGDRVDDNFELYQEVAVPINDNITLAVGHTNTGALYSDDGQRNNVGLTTSDTELYYLRGIISF
jgi:hypothetical protein